MRHLSIDIETYSSVPINKAGAQAYARSPDFEVLLLAYSVDNAPVAIIDLAQGDVLPQWLIDALQSDDYIKHAYNAAFEIVCLSIHLGRQLDPSQWRCTMLHAMYRGYTSGLGITGSVLGLQEDAQKLKTGAALIRYFCVPCNPTKANGGRVRNLPQHDPQRWHLFKLYCMQDVVSEMAIAHSLTAIQVPPSVQKQWELDMRINSRGVAVDMQLVEGAMAISEAAKDDLLSEAKQITRLDNPNSVPQLKAWLSNETNTEIPDLTKATVSELLGSDTVDEQVKQMLGIRKELSKTSNKKYNAIESAICPDGRIRGMLQFYGANRTGRWAGRFVQVHNLPQTHLDCTDLARELVAKRDMPALEVVYGSELNSILSQLIRTAFVASPGHVLIDADFAAIEARVISWLAGEKWRLKVFEDGGDIYCASASQMFHVPVVKGGENGHLRAKGKVAELALGYQGGTRALISMGALNMGLTEEELPGIVEKWREANSQITRLWQDVEAAAYCAITTGSETQICPISIGLKLDLQLQRKMLIINLPSGRALYYNDPQIVPNRWGRPSIAYMGVHQDTKKWQLIETYGGKLTENVVQAIARDCLAEAITRLEKNGYPVVFHVHDEVVIDIEPYACDTTMLQDVIDIMRQPVPWAPGLPLSADGWVGQYFTKD